MPLVYDKAETDLDETQRAILRQARSGYGGLPPGAASQNNPMSIAQHQASLARLNENVIAAAGQNGTAQPPNMGMLPNTTLPRLPDVIPTAPRPGFIPEQNALKAATGFPGTQAEIGQVASGAVPGYAAKTPGARVFAAELAKQGIHPVRDAMREKLTSEAAARVPAAQAALDAAPKATGVATAAVPTGKSNTRQAALDRIAQRKANRNAPGAAPLSTPGVIQAVQDQNEARLHPAHSAPANDPTGSLAVLESYKQRGALGKGMDENTLKTVAEFMQPAQYALFLDRLKGDSGTKMREPNFDELYQFIEPEVQNNWKDQSQDNRDAALQRAKQRYRRLYGFTGAAQPEQQYDQADLEHTAQLHGITVEEVKRRLNAR